MKVFLMFPDRDLTLPKDPPPQAEALVQDLALEVLFAAMAQGDRFLLNVAQGVVLSSQADVAVLRYRQEILQDCLDNPTVLRELYSIPIQALENKQKHWLGVFGRQPSGILDSSIRLLDMYVVLLRQLRRIADTYAERFQSAGFRRFFAMIQKELDDACFEEMTGHLKTLKFRNGVPIRVWLGRGNEGRDYMLCKPTQSNWEWVERALGKRSPVYSFTIPTRDDHGFRAMREIRDRGLNVVANAVAQAADHVESFLNILRLELAFYLGCLNLSERLAALQQPICLPELSEAGTRQRHGEGLYDACLALTTRAAVVGNTLQADGKDLVLITGANQGGKSTFLRSVGLAQVMAQCGMFVPARRYATSVCSGIFTHYRREEDTTMRSGKFDEELGRMSQIVDWLHPNGLVLFNESFAATNEREGSEIGRQIIQALLDRHIEVFFITHQYELASGFWRRGWPNVLFLRAERQEDGSRTFLLQEGEPLPTSFGEDMYARVFAADQSASSEER